MNDENAYYGKFIVLSKDLAEKDLSESDLNLISHCIASALRQTDMLLQDKFDKETSKIIMDTYGNTKE